ncbi:hypothetical protein ONZ43_g4480 [Nemania bipapillata]|uniref:Uncharacterized protein n=1 Tax=Nemania bipapillata TaxID=110536 RepID=A0ACC2IMG6_9PEZI|nr:hypothetical protein ONZ43_g4480 [Nemania bipapillata]
MSPKLTEVLRGRLFGQIGEISEIQSYIPVHVAMLNRGDQQLREDYWILQKYYREALGLSVDQIREYVQQVDLAELEGLAGPLMNMRTPMKVSSSHPG